MTVEGNSPLIKSFQEAADMVKSSLDIIDLVSRYVVLKKAGRNHTGLCPFHKDRNPSFSVSPSKNLYKCFSCGEGGDALSFMMKIESKTYGQVIKDLAEEQNILIQDDGQDRDAIAKKQDTNLKILELNKKAQAWYAQQLTIPEAEAARQYLNRREISNETVKTFGLGHALPSWESLTSHLLATVDFAKEDPELLITAGMSNGRQEGNGYYDRFRNRLTVPIHDESGRIVGFGGRALSDEDKPKYLNTPETSLYQKSKLLYGLFQAKKSIQENHYAIVMEGYFDVISAHMAGVTQAVGSCGTALTDRHLKLLTRFGAETIYLAFDSDEAGLKAALSAITLIEPYLESSNLKIKIVIVPDGKDPDDFIRNHDPEQQGNHAAGGEAFKKLLTHAISHLDFKCQQAIKGLDTREAEGRVQAANQLTPILSAIKQPILRREYLDRYADRIGVQAEDLSQEIQGFLQKSNPSPAPVHSLSRRRKQNDTKNFSDKRAISNHPRTLNRRTGQEPRSKRTPILEKQYKAEKALLQLLFLDKQSYGAMEPIVKKHQFTHNIHQSLVGYLPEINSDEETLNDVIQKLSGLTAEQPELQHALTDLVFSAETFAESIALDAIPPSEVESTVLNIAKNYQQTMRKIQIRQHQTQQLKEMKELEQSVGSKQDASNQEISEAPVREEESEVPQLKLQYEFRDNLSKTRNDLL